MMNRGYPASCLVWSLHSSLIIHRLSFEKMKRRNFIKKAGQTAAITPFVVNGYSMTPFANLQLANMINCNGVNDRVLVLIQMKGGNDGLNTIVPINQYDKYASLRPTIKIADTGANKFIDLDTTTKWSHRAGLHPNMTEVKAMYDAGLVNLVQGVGYTNPNQSHFKSTDLWFSGGDGTSANFNIPSGWIGRSLQAFFPQVKGLPTPEMLDPLGIQLGDPNPNLGFHTESEHENYINLAGQDVSGFYSLISTIGGLPPADIPDTDMGHELEYIKSVESSVDAYAQRISAVFNAGSNAGTYPSIDLANQLKTIARLIRGGCKTKIYLCTIGGFDTHDGQVDPANTSIGVHADLMGRLSKSVKAFFDDLQAAGTSEQVMAVTFSEFGRCMKENGSYGTDHGTVAPMFIFGKGVKPGLTGANIDLSNLTNDNQVKTISTDYRQVFGALIQDWLGGNDYVMSKSYFDKFAKANVVGESFKVLPNCQIGGTDIIIDNQAKLAAQELTVFPNPCRDVAEVWFPSERGFAARVGLFSLQGALVSAKDVVIEPGDNLFYLEVGSLPVGPYFVRLDGRLGEARAVAKLMVIR